MFITRRRQADLELVERLDPAYWHPGYEGALAHACLPLRPLGDFITAITYGPIVTGMRPPPCADGLVVVHQGQVAATGVDPRRAGRVAPGSPWDSPRARLQAGDIVLPRSGEASVAKNRVAIFLGDYPALVGSFVDLVRVAGLDPVYLLVCLKSAIVWSQIHRLINGVGTPNLSFAEVRSLRIPMVDEPTQLDFRARYLENVHQAHHRWLAGDREAGERGARALRALAARLDALVAGADPDHADPSAPRPWPG